MKQIVFAYSIIISFIIFIADGTSAQEQKSLNFSNAKDHLTFLGGFGFTHPGLGDTHVKVENIDFVFQYGYFLSEEIGTSWYKFRHEILFEIPFSYVYKPENAIMTGVNFLACWDFTASEILVPYVFVGGGFVYTNLNVPGLGSDYNGNYQGGLGLHYFIKDDFALNLNYRIHHISNASTAEPNDPLNSSKFLVGITLFMN